MENSQRLKISLVEVFIALFALTTTCLLSIYSAPHQHRAFKIHKDTPETLNPFAGWLFKNSLFGDTIVDDSTRQTYEEQMYGKGLITASIASVCFAIVVALRQRASDEDEHHNET